MGATEHGELAKRVGILGNSGSFRELDIAGNTRRCTGHSRHSCKWARMLVNAGGPSGGALRLARHRLQGIKAGWRRGLAVSVSTARLAVSRWPKGG